MKVIKKSRIDAVIEVVEEKSKFQKVMLLYDDTVTEFEVNEILYSIKNLCVFNKKYIKDLNENELFDGYKLIVYFCSAKSILSLKFNRGEFVNLYLPTEDKFMPYFINYDNEVLSDLCYLQTEKSILEYYLILSLKVNYFYKKIESIKNNEFLNFDDKIGSFASLKEEYCGLLNNCKDLEFVDIKILKKTSLDFSYLPLVDLILVDGFLLFLNNVKYGEIEFVDLYKSIRDDVECVERFYAISNDRDFFNTIKLSFVELNRICLNIKNDIKEFGDISSYSIADFELVFNAIKAYAKKCEDLMGYFYLFNFFGV